MEVTDISYAKQSKVKNGLEEKIFALTCLVVTISY